MSRKEKKRKKRGPSTRELMGIQAVEEICLKTDHGDLVYFIIQPTNISVLSNASISARIYAFMNVVKGMTEVEALCLNSRENFEGNKQFLRQRIRAEGNPAIRTLLEKDLSNLDRIQVQMATAREFLIVLRLRDPADTDVLPYLARVEKALKDQGFTSRRATAEDIKRMLAVYFEQNVTTEQFEESDGERWIVFGD